ncbi:MAG TPA: conjugative transposon protein TraN [Flavisolibacter sp.]|nr:conjugative transposon protein TraN [Flavisolibacter sp.]
MKRFMCLIAVLWLCVSASAQTSLCISTDKTTSLIFPFAIKHVDRGTQTVLAQQVKDAPSILLVKAGTKGFSETNLSVVTEDGSLYSFRVCYDDKPATWVYHLPVQGKESIANTAAAIADNPKFIKWVKDKRWDMKAELIGIYIKDDVMYYQLLLTNQSSINYDIELLRFYIADKKKGKRTGVQEAELKPLHTSGNSALVAAGTSSTIVVALEKFTIPDAKFLGVQLLEKNGGRHLNLKLSNGRLMKARPVK